MSNPVAQETLHGYFAGDKVGYTERNTGYVCEILEVVSHNHIHDYSMVKLLLPNGATVLALDSVLGRIPSVDTSHH